MKNYEAFRQFADGQLRINDTDPHVQVINVLSDDMNMSHEDRLWYGILFFGFYQDGSAYASFSDEAVRRREKIPFEGYPISYQRRNLFGGRIVEHFKSVYSIASLADYFDINTWADLIARLEMFYGNGRWASFTTAELLAKIALKHIKPDTAEIAGSSGPLQGLQFLGVENPSDKSVFELQDRLLADGVYSEVADIEKLESVLCNWSRMCKGDFYLGHNLDRQHDRIRKVEREHGKDMTRLWEARSKVFPHEALAEKHGRWSGVDKVRKKFYASTGKVLQPTEGR